MSYSATISLVANDTAPPITMTLRDSNTAAPGQTLDPENELTWAPIDLTGATVLFKIRATGATVIKETLAGTLTDPVNGEVVLVWSPTALDTAGVFEVEVEVTYPDTTVQTVVELIRLKIREDF